MDCETGILQRCGSGVPMKASAVKRMSAFGENK